METVCRQSAHCLSLVSTQPVVSRHITLPSDGALKTVRLRSEDRQTADKVEHRRRSADNPIEDERIPKRRLGVMCRKEGVHNLTSIPQFTPPHHC